MGVSIDMIKQIAILFNGEYQGGVCNHFISEEDDNVQTTEKVITNWQESNMTKAIVEHTKEKEQKEITFYQGKLSFLSNKSEITWPDYDDEFTHYSSSKTILRTVLNIDSSVG